MKQYKKPTIEVEMYEPQEDLTAACEVNLTFGPDACTGYGFDDLMIKRSAALNGSKFYPFYDDLACDCYDTAPSQVNVFAS